MISPRLLWLAAAVFAAGGAALRTAPSPVTTTPAPAVAPPAAPTMPASTAPDGQARYAGIVTSNAFASTRKPPAVRFVPEGLRRDTAPPPAPPKKPAEPALRLFGITRGPGGAVALIDADPSVPGAEVYQVGDRVRDGRLSNIAEMSVTVTRPSGPVVLRLPDVEDRR